MASLTHIFPSGFLPVSEVAPQPPEVQLRVAMSDAGIQPPSEIIMDGTLRRFANSAKKGDLSGWYIAHDGELPAGAFGDWKSGIEQTWRADIGREFSLQESIAHAARMREIKAKREKELAETRENAAQNALEIWEAAPLASDDHPYIRRKGVTNPGWRLATDGRLIAPLYLNGELVSLQYIAQDGSKLFLKGGKTGGAWWSIGGGFGDDGRIYIGEGVATAASVFEATGRPVVIAYSAGNLPAVAAAVRAQVGPLRDIVIVADNDESGTGAREAQKAAEAAKCEIIMPPILGDANDYAQAGHDLGALLDPVKNNANSAVDRLNIVFADSLGQDFHAPDELVEGVITVGASSVVYGDSNSGKTFFVLDMACAIARGAEWMGRRTEPGLVIYLATEAPQSIKTRIQTYQKHHNCIVSNFAIVQTPVNMHRDNRDAKDIVEAIQAIEAQYNMPARLIVGDTLARMSAGANENSGEDMGPVMERMEYISRKTGAHMLTIHHNGKDAAKGARGWSGIRAHIDTEIELTESNNIRTATITKQRELGGKGDSIVFKLQVIEIGITKWGKPATSCVVIQDDNNMHQLVNEPENISKARKSYEGALLKYGYIDSDGDLYVTTDNWEHFEIENNRHLKPNTCRQYITKSDRYPGYLNDYITPKNGGYSVKDEAKFVGIRLLMSKRGMQ